MWTARSLWPSLTLLALLGALASFFGPDERWGGVDIGATGSAVFNLALIGAVILISMRPQTAFPEHWSLAETRAWVGLVFTALIFFGFVKFLYAVAALDAVPTTIDALPVRHFIWVLTTLFIAWAITSGVLAYRGGPDLDERDLRMRHQADRAGDWALTGIVVASICLLVRQPALRLEWWLEPLVLANVLVGVLTFKGLVEYAALVAYYAVARR